MVRMITKEVREWEGLGAGNSRIRFVTAKVFSMGRKGGGEQIEGGDELPSG
jgi:hypothetical protein